MGENTGISWTDHSFSPWWGCQRVSPGCEHCYAEAFSKRVGHGKRLPSIWGPTGERRFFGDAHWNEPRKWNAKAEKAGRRARVFCASMADVFEDRPELAAPRARLWRLISDTPQLDWLLLTKRPENAGALADVAALHAWDGGGIDAPTWPTNIWLGTTVEDQRRAEERIPHLLAVPAAVRFLSCEPLLEAVSLEEVRSRNGLLASALGGECWGDCRCDDVWGPEPGCRRNGGDGALTRKVDWVIVGGESGGGARPFDLAWARSIVEECRYAGVPCFVKQAGARPTDGGALLKLRDRKGGALAELPADLRVREWPSTETKAMSKHGSTCHCPPPKRNEWRYWRCGSPECMRASNCHIQVCDGVFIHYCHEHRPDWTFGMELGNAPETKP